MKRISRRSVYRSQGLGRRFWLVLQSLLVLSGLLADCEPSVWAVDHVTVLQGEKSVRYSGRLVTEAEDGGLLLLTPDGVLHPFQPRDYVSKSSDDQPFKPWSREEMEKRVLAEMPPGFKVHATANYLICYNTSTAYAQWCGSLYERLYRGFRNYWETRGLPLHDPELPLVAMVFDSKFSYLRHVREELGDAAESIVGFYSPLSNRMNMYDLTGLEGLKLTGQRISTAALVNQILSQPAAAPMVATIVHEATHQLAYNCGLQTRLADNPVWVSEGLAVFFETPDLKSPKVWTGIGNVNHHRLVQFRRSLNSRSPGAIMRLVRDDERFKSADTTLDAYAEAWALNFFLLRTRNKEYVAYLRELSTKSPSVFDTPEERLAALEAVFGDLEKLEVDFLRYMRKVE
ncbi:MAG: DUF1570 domain-containing protein [Planctomycetota bacterium]